MRYSWISFNKIQGVLALSVMLMSLQIRRIFSIVIKDIYNADRFREQFFLQPGLTKYLIIFSIFDVVNL